MAGPAGRIDTFPSFAKDVSRALRDTWHAETLTGLVNNAGLSHAAPFEQMTEAAFDELVDALFKRPYLLTQALVPLLADGGFGGARPDSYPLR